MSRIRTHNTHGDEYRFHINLDPTTIRSRDSLLHGSREQLPNVTLFSWIHIRVNRALKNV
jgi:hypothetical protein